NEIPQGCRNGSGEIELQWRSLVPGIYWVTVQTGTMSGNVTATVDSTPGTAVPPNDTCGGAITLISPSMPSHMGTTVGFADNLTGCNTATGKPDAFYRFNLCSQQQVMIQVEPAQPRMLYLTLRRVTPSCSETNDAVCASAEFGTCVMGSNTL